MLQFLCRFGGVPLTLVFPELGVEGVRQGVPPLVAFVRSSIASVGVWNTQLASESSQETETGIRQPNPPFDFLVKCVKKWSALYLNRFSIIQCVDVNDYGKYIPLLFWQDMV